MPAKQEDIICNRDVPIPNNSSTNPCNNNNKPQNNDNPTLSTINNTIPSNRDKKKKFSTVLSDSSKKTHKKSYDSSMRQNTAVFLGEKQASPSTIVNIDDIHLTEEDISKSRRMFISPLNNDLLPKEGFYFNAGGIENVNPKVNGVLYFGGTGSKKENQKINYELNIKWSSSEPIFTIFYDKDLEYYILRFDHKNANEPNRASAPRIKVSGEFPLNILMKETIEINDKFILLNPYENGMIDVIKSNTKVKKTFHPQKKEIIIGGNENSTIVVEEGGKKSVKLNYLMSFCYWILKDNGEGDCWIVGSNDYIITNEMTIKINDKCIVFKSV